MEGLACPGLDLLKFWVNSGSSLKRDGWFKSRRPVVIYDSGVGGLTVANHVKALCPNVDLLYVADNEWFPYGNKSSSAVASRANEIIKSLKLTVNPLAVIVACNTASVAINDFNGGRAEDFCFKVIPPVEEAAFLSLKKNVALLATPGTLRSNTVKATIAAQEGYAKIWPVAAQKLVELSEKKVSGVAIKDDEVRHAFGEQIARDDRESIDTVILGCTHFPHLIEELCHIFPAVKNWVDPALLVAMQLRDSIGVGEVLNARPIRLAVFTKKEGLNEYRRAFVESGFNWAPTRHLATESAAAGWN